MKTKVSIFFIILFLSAGLYPNITSPINGKSFNIGTNVTFTWSGEYISPDFEKITRWVFPDGVVNVSGAPNMHTENHQVKRTGAYTARVDFTVGASNGNESILINIIENRSILSTNDQFIAETPIKFKANNFSTPSEVRWVMGDGTSKISFSDFTHTYSKPGTYTVKAYDFNGDTNSTPVTFVVTVSARRYITVSPSIPYASQLLTFKAVNFLTPNSIKWDMGDGTILNIKKTITKKGAKILSGSTIQYTYSNPGNYTVRAYDNNGSQDIPVSLSVAIAMPNRQIVYSPKTNIRVDQPVYFGARGFLTKVIDWNFGDGIINSGAKVTIMHRFQTSGTWTVTAKDLSIDHSPIAKQILILPENRELRLASPEVRVNETIQISALNFRGDLILWDFGDGKHESSGNVINHVYKRAGNYIIKARDENGESKKEFTATIIVRGITDEVNLEIAEIRLDNGKYYKVVPRNSKDLKAVLRMKMRGTGAVTGYWLVDGNPFEYFNELAVQGELKELFTGTIPGLPTLEPGIHTVSVRLTKPSEVALTFPVLKYFVLPTDIIMVTISPKDGLVVKEKKIPTFSWKEPKGASKYQIVFSNYLYPILTNDKATTLVEIGSKLSYKPSKTVWDKIKRNKWTHWKVRAYDTNKQFIAESEIQDIKVVIATAEISLNSIKDLDGNKIKISNGIVRSDKKNLLIGGNITYKGNSKFIVLRVYSGEEMIDQLLFRDVKKDETRNFETSIPNIGNDTKIKFEVLKTSSPSVIIGIKGLILRKKQ